MVTLASSATLVTSQTTISLTATATADLGVVRVEFYDGTTLLGTDTTPPYVRNVALAYEDNGVHSYTARAYDAADSAGTSAVVVVTVSVAGPDLPPTAPVGGRPSPSRSPPRSGFDGGVRPKSPPGKGRKQKPGGSPLDATSRTAEARPARGERACRDGRSCCE